ncbi:type IV toxin-antitoxin system AbiEi family antitoxin domain-containing protein [Candidatus Kaiserbacteria bacterium]|nr:type IV toxin-antitoxin system AbiEi family antitoxin domain-containing protein [Candidatus Kaiserbacteria bacterium]
MAKLVNQHHFVAKIKRKQLGLFSKRDVQALFKVSTVSATFLLHRYTKRGIILKVKRGLYTLPDLLPPDTYIANRLYSPSYVSREFALSYHGIIPETVYVVTSVSTKAARRFEALGKLYTYRRIKKEAFTGYSTIRQNGFSFNIADAEKAFVDALYYRVIFREQPMNRFSKKKIDPAKALRYAALFGNRKLIAILKQTLL